jgi:hypothetical protein
MRTASSRECIRFVLVTASAAWLVSLGAASATAQPYEHLICYKTKDAKTFASAGATLSALQAEFGALGCTIKPKAKQVCVPGDAAVAAVDGGSYQYFPSEDLAYDRLCYRIKCTGTIPADLTMSDAFGSRSLQKLKAATLCTPAVVGPAPTTTTTTLPPLPPCVGGGGFPACTGDCSGVGPSHYCDPRNGEGSCACVLPCNDLDPQSGDICGTGGCPVDSRCALVDPDHCGCIFDAGS